MAACFAADSSFDSDWDWGKWPKSGLGASPASGLGGQKGQSKGNSRESHGQGLGDSRGYGPSKATPPNRTTVERGPEDPSFHFSSQFFAFCLWPAIVQHQHQVIVAINLPEIDQCLISTGKEQPVALGFCLAILCLGVAFVDRLGVVTNQKKTGACLPPASVNRQCRTPGFCRIVFWLNASAAPTTARKTLFNRVPRKPSLHGLMNFILCVLGSS